MISMTSVHLQTAKRLAVTGANHDERQPILSWSSNRSKDTSLCFELKSTLNNYHPRKLLLSSEATPLILVPISQTSNTGTS